MALHIFYFFIYQDIEKEYEHQMEILQNELEKKYEINIRELREEFDIQGREITTSAIDELQRKHFIEMDNLKSEHEHMYMQMTIAKEKKIDELKVDIQVS